MIIRFPDSPRMRTLCAELWRIRGTDTGAAEAVRGGVITHLREREAIVPAYYR